jgi:hypothetical protein
MKAPPDPPEMRSPAAANGRANRNGDYQPHQVTESVSVLQAEKLRRLYSFCRATAAEIARLAFAVSR